MEPISVGASITGLLTAGAQIAVLLQRFIDAPSFAHSVGVEIQHFIVVLSQLQPFVMGSLPAAQSRSSMIEVQQIQLILTGCVLTFSELQAAVVELSQGSTGNTRIWRRMKWAWEETSITALLHRLRDHKSSLTLILTILTCQSTSEAITSISDLRGLLEHLIQCNTDLFNRVLELEAQPQQDNRVSIASASTRSRATVRHAFETILFDSRLYQKALRKTTGPRPASMCWSMLSGLSLSEVSNVSVYRLAISPADISNPECYTTTSSTGTASTGLTHDESNDRPRLTLLSPISEGEDKAIEERDAEGCTELLLACRNGQHTAASALLAGGAKIETFDSRGFTPIYWATCNGHHDTLRVLLEAGAKEWRWASSGTSLHVVASNGHHQSVKVLIDAGGAKDAKNSSGDTPLHLAAIDGHHESVRVLLEAGADKDVKNTNDDTALFLAVSAGHHKSVRALLERGANVGGKGYLGNTLLHWAASGGRRETVKVLLVACVEMDVRNFAGYTPMHLAAKSGHHESVRILLEACVEKDVKNFAGDTPLHSAARYGHQESMKLLLEAMVDKDARDQTGYTPLHVASEQGYLECVKILVGSGANIEAKDYNNCTPLLCAVASRHRNTVQALLKAGADYEAKGNSNLTPLELASKMGDRHMVRLFEEWLLFCVTGPKVINWM